MQVSHHYFSFCHLDLNAHPMTRRLRKYLNTSILCLQSIFSQSSYTEHSSFCNKNISNQLISLK